MTMSPHAPPSPPAWLAEPDMNLTMGEAASVLGSLLKTTVGMDTIRGERFCNDTRILQQGDIFIALSGNRNGHDFVPAAMAQGAAFAIVVEWPLPVELSPEQGILVVRDVDAALVRLATWWRSRFDIPVVGIGGGVGKTTTKETVAALLAHRYGQEHILKTPANWNDMRGNCLTLLGLRPLHRFAVIEMGMDRPGEVAQLGEVVRPQIGIITSVSATHLEYFSDMSELIATERGMLDSLRADGLALLNDNDRLVRGMLSHAQCRVMMVGTFADDDLRAQHISSRGTTGLHFSFTYLGKTYEISTHLIGKHLVTSALMAIGVALQDGWTIADIIAGMSSIHIPLRMQFKNGKHASMLIDDTYNASPESMLAALKFLADWPSEQDGRRLALLGTMRELGPRSTREHHRLGRRAAEYCEIVWVTGDERAAIADGAIAGGLCEIRSFADPADAAQDIIATLLPHDVLLIKASHAVGLDRIVPLLEDKLHNQE